MITTMIEKRMELYRRLISEGKSERETVTACGMDPDKPAITYGELMGKKSEILDNTRSHKWGGMRRGGNPSEATSYEWVRYCLACGIEDTCEDDLPPCPCA